jgi:hypothetical protein
MENTTYIQERERSIIMDLFMREIMKATTEDDLNTIRYLVAINIVFTREERVCLIDSMIDRELDFIHEKKKK